MDPTFLVNRLIYPNLIQYSDYSNLMNRKEEVDSFKDKDTKLSILFRRKDVYQQSNEPLNRDYFAMILKSLEPKDLKSPLKKSFNKHTELLNAYESFVMDIQSNNGQSDITLDREKWYQFQQLFKTKTKEEGSYAVHP